MEFVSSEKPQCNGIALGGIGTGSVELWPDGEFHAWQISNQSRWGGQIDRHDAKLDDGEQYAGALSFWVRTEDEEGSTVVRKLGYRTEDRDFTYRMYAWNRPVRKISYHGRFPVCELRYEDEALPCSVWMKAVAPFVPNRLEYAALPGFQLKFTLTNPTDKPLKVSLIGSVIPDFANGGNCANHLHILQDRVSVHITPETRSEAPDCGDLTFSVAGDGRNTWLTGEMSAYLREFVSHSSYGITQESFLFPFRETGNLPDTDAGTRPDPIPEHPELLEWEALAALGEKLSRYPFAIAFLERMRAMKKDFPASREDYEGFVSYCARQIRDKGASFGAAALGKAVTIEPGTSKEIRFCLTWFFPNHFSREGKRIGHFYERLVHDSLEAADLLADHPDIFQSAEAFSELLFRADVPDCYPDAWSAHLSTLVKSSWLLEDGRFGLWEGLSYCGFHTTDITYQASFALLSLFPELQLRQMRMGAAFQREDGRVHHCFTPDLDHVDDGFDRVDMNPQFVLMVCRDYLYTGDTAYLRELWPHVLAAMENSMELDGDGDGLPDRDTARNTYDAWNFSGTPAFLSILWLAALKAGVVLAEKLGKPEQAACWNRTLARGKEALERKLWNGAYYNLWATPDDVDESLMTDQLDGEWFLRMAGLEGNLPDERVRKVLSVIWHENFDPEDGLINASCPKGRKISIFTYRNCQAEAVWTGVGYLYAALCLSVGLPEIAEKEIRKIHENQAAFGLFWNHWECGPYYTRPLSSWTTLNALLGLKMDASVKKMTLCPTISSGSLPLCVPGVLAEVKISASSCEICCMSGSLDGWDIHIEGRDRTTCVFVRETT